MGSNEVIIDGCNVAECYFYYKGECRCELNCIDLYKNETITELAIRTPEHNYMECKPSDNCYFKQLQRKTKECENAIHNWQFSEKLYSEIKAELEQLHKKYYHILNLAKQNADSSEYCMQELEAENEKLKENLAEAEATMLTYKIERDNYKEALIDIKVDFINHSARNGFNKFENEIFIKIDKLLCP